MRPLSGLAAAVALIGAAAPPVARYPAVTPGYRLSFPADHGAHPAFRTEWWYVTGWLKDAGGHERGFQVTFFRSRPPTDPADPSRFAPRQIIFAHAALSDSAVGHILAGERAARAGFGLAGAATGDAAVHLRDWAIVRAADGRWRTQVATPDFALSLAFTPTQPVLPEGEGGYSRKGPDPAQASEYYSIPHLAVAGTIRVKGRAVAVTGTAWLDREWSSTYLAPGAVGWDWTGLNLPGGGALMAFRIRGGDGRAIWAGGSFRDGAGHLARLGPGDVSFRPLARWRSPATGAVYPVAQLLKVRLPGGPIRLPLRPLFADQEIDGRRHGMPVYWEGAVRTDGGGRGYLELTGYAGALAL